MSDPFYVNRLYPLQDVVLKSIGPLETEFYLTGGTALSRAYLEHRYSDDLDFFVNRSVNFKQQVNLILECLKRNRLTFETGAMSDEFIRIMIRLENVVLKIDFVNDVEAHFGFLTVLEGLFPRIDSWRNILSNKVCALSRLEPKDFVDIFFIALKYPFDWEQIISEAREKDLWVEPITVSRLIREFSIRNIQTIKWIKPVNEAKLLKLVETVSDDILKGSTNSAFELENTPKP
jgi:hypothetical protein